MINGVWFLRNVNDLEDLTNYVELGVITGEDYKELKRIALGWVDLEGKYRSLRLINKNLSFTFFRKMSEYFHNLYSDVIERMEAIEHEQRRINNQG